MLHQHINDIAVLIDRPIQIVSLSLNGHKDFVDVPHITQPLLALCEFSSLVRPKLLTPLANGFIGHRDSTFSQEFFHFTEAETESMIQPYSVTNNFRGKSVASVAGLGSFHAAQSATSELN